MNSYPDFISDFIEEISDSLNYNKSVTINVTDEGFDKNHDFRMLVNSFTNFFNAVLVESCNGSYFIINRDTGNDNYTLLVSIIEDESDVLLNAALFRNVDDARKAYIFSEIQDGDGNFQKFYKY